MIALDTEARQRSIVTDAWNHIFCTHELPRVFSEFEMLNKDSSVYIIFKAFDKMYALQVLEKDSGTGRPSKELIIHRLDSKLEKYLKG